jgi:hypothetical protein
MSNPNVNVVVSGPKKEYTSTYKTHILRGNMSFADQVTEPNMKYVIKYNFVLNGDVTIPENCILEFDGGNVSGEHTITCQDTILVYTLNEDDVLTDVVLAGSFKKHSGNYNDLENKPEIPEIPTNVSAFNNDANYQAITASDTASRPTDINTGFQYFDITLNKPIWWNGSDWVDATGATV